MVAKIPVPLPSPLLETMLHQAPLDVLLFDTDLVCRYAAPAGDTLFGRTADQLSGQHAADIFPPARGDLRSALELAAHGAQVYQYPSYRYTYTDTASTTEMLFCWSVRVEPVVLRDYRGQEEFRGVLVTLADVQDLADENDRLKRDKHPLDQEHQRLQDELAEAQRREAASLEAGRKLRAVVRNLLTMVMGYLQILSRRPDALRGRPSGEVVEQIVLPGLGRVVDAMDTLESAQPPTDRSGRPH